NQQNLGLCATRNLAFRRCRGEFVCSLSGDDVYEPTKLARELELFRSCGSQVGAVFSDMVVIDDDGVFERRWFDGRTHFAEEDIFDALVARGCFIPTPTVMSRRAVIDEVGGYDERLFAEDYDMWLRIADRYAFRYVDEPLVRYRRSPAGMSRS